MPVAPCMGDERCWEESDGSRRSGFGLPPPLLLLGRPAGPPMFARRRRKSGIDNQSVNDDRKDLLPAVSIYM